LLYKKRSQAFGKKKNLPVAMTSSRGLRQPGKTCERAHGNVSREKVWNSLSREYIIDDELE
jgi:hypothetical protein